MDKNHLIPGMIVKITFGKGPHGPKGKWSSLIWVFAVTRCDNEKIIGIQYKTIAVKGGEYHPASYYQFTKPEKIEMINKSFDQWWETFNAKILV
jgi:hypothetical protein